MVNDNTTLTDHVRQTAEQVKRNTDLLDEIHRHVAALTPEAGRFRPGEEPSPAGT